MSEYLKGPTAAGQISDTKTRVHTLERRLLGTSDKPAVYIAKWSLGGPIYPSESGYEMHPSGGTLLRIYATLLTAGSSTTTLDIKKNDVVIKTLKMPSGVKFNEQLVSVPFSASGDLLNVEIMTAGSGAASISVFGEFDR